MNAHSKLKRSYTQDDLLSAVAAVKNGTSFMEASKAFSVPYTTLHNKFNEKYKKDRKGPNTALTSDQEARLAKHMIYMAKVGYGYTRKDIRPLVAEEIKLIDKNRANIGLEELKLFGEDRMPSMSWVYRFLSRWPELSCRIPENLGYQRNAVTEEKIRSWFDSLEEFMIKEHNIQAQAFFTQENSSRIFNCDESGFPLAGTAGKLKVITQRGAKSVYKMAPDSKEQVTALCCASADGKFCKPFIIFPGVKPKFNLERVNVEDYDLGNSSNGWITADCFFGWIANLFYPQVKDKVKFPIVLFLDGHTSHINIAVAQFCFDHDIILYCLPPHASHILQPLDVSVFGPMKKKWNDSLEAFKKEYKGLSMSRTHFFPVFDKCWKNSTSADNVKAGFRKCGLVPWDREAVPYDRIIDSVKISASLEKTEKKVSDQERIGMLRMHQMILSCIPAPLMDTLVKRKEEGYDINDDTALGTLWKIFSSSYDMISRTTTSDPDGSSLTQSSSEGEPREINNSTNDGSADNPGNAGTVEDINTAPHSSNDIYLDSIPSTSGAGLSEPENIVTDNSQTENLNSSELNNSYVSLEYSPFKSHKVISNDVIITRKISINKTKVPFAISAREHVNHLKEKQDKKKRELDEKEKRKEDRLNKKKKKVAKSSNKSPEENDENENVEMILDDSEDELPEINTNVCRACHGEDGWDEPDLWIGCSGFGRKKCDHWFHKACLSEDVAKMDEDQLKEYELLCEMCTTKSKMSTRRSAK